MAELDTDGFERPRLTRLSLVVWVSKHVKKAKRSIAMTLEEDEEARIFQEEIAQNKLRNQAMLRGLGITEYLQSLNSDKLAAEKER